jgi:hypothetical protein
VSRQSSDFRQGVEAAAKWLATKHKDVALAGHMLLEVADDPEGTEARTVAQIVQFMRETAFGQSDRVGGTEIERLAASIAAGDWKRQ